MKSFIYRFCYFIAFLAVISPLFSLLFSAPVRAKHGMVVSAHPIASRIGIDIMKRGGNAVDAAVGVGFALAVVLPEAGNIGGGGFMLIRNINGETAAIDFREKAPEAAWRNMYLDTAGNVSEDIVRGHRSSGVPGTVAGLVKAHEKYGTMNFAELVQPAIDLAEGGFAVDQHLEENLAAYEYHLRKSKSAVKVFFMSGRPFKEGDTIKQPDLAATLRRIQQFGAADFYKGETARLILEEVKRGGGLITKKDLDEYQAVFRKPLQGTYRGYEIISMPPPSSGGICLIEMLNLLEGYNLASFGFHSSRSVHIITEVMKLVYADRAEFMADPDFVAIPVDVLISKQYADQRRKLIDSIRAAPSKDISSGKESIKNQFHTTHYSIIDASGNCAAVTYTINDLFGSRVMVDSAGFFLNNEMDDFSSKPGIPNSYGLLGGDANSIEPGKRPLSSMAPTIVAKEGKPVMILGARGGAMIITGVLQALINVIDFGMNLREAVDAPRFHHQLLPDELIYERYCFPDDVIKNLGAMGHLTREVKSKIGSLEAIYIDSNTGWIYGAPDAREGGAVNGF